MGGGWNPPPPVGNRVKVALQICVPNIFANVDRGMSDRACKLADKGSAMMIRSLKDNNFIMFS